MSFPLHQARWLPVVLSFGFMAASSVACAAEVTIVRDTWGVPHIFGQTEEAVAYGLGVAQCEDNLAIVVRNLYAGVGRLAELFGPQYLDGDIEARTLGHAHFARRDWPNLDPRVRLLVEAYCA